MVFSFQLDIYLYQLRCKLQGTGCRVQGITDKGEDRILTKQFYVESTYRRYYGIPSEGVGNPCHQDILFHAQ